MKFSKHKGNNTEENLGTSRRKEEHRKQKDEGIH